MTCKHCGKPVTLIPSAAERARKSNHPASYYTALFPDHADCIVAARSQEAIDLMSRLVT